MKYYLGLLGLPLSSQIEISVKQYNSIISDSELLKMVAAVEERYDIIVSNYTEYEKARLNIAIDAFTYLDLKIIKYLEYRRELFRLLNNLLSSCRLYFDQNEKDITPKSEIIGCELSKIRAQMYDSSFSYRLLEYLRNSLQHRTMPIEVTLNRNFKNHFGKKS